MMDIVNAVADEIANAVLKRLGPITSKKWTETNREIVDWVQVGLEKARDSALEEAAKVAEEWLPFPLGASDHYGRDIATSIAAAILKLKTKA